MKEDNLKKQRHLQIKLIYLLLESCEKMEVDEEIDQFVVLVCKDFLEKYYQEYWKQLQPRLESVSVFEIILFLISELLPLLSQASMFVEEERMSKIQHRIQTIRSGL